MDLLLEMLEDGTVAPDDNISTYDRAFSADIERLEKDSAAIRTLVRAGKAPATVDNPIDYLMRQFWISD